MSTYEVLRYIRSAFDDEDVLDAVPLEAAGNPGAWHAWRTHRRLPAGKALSGQGEGAAATTRRPEEWNWEGVWEERVKRGTAASLSEGVLFGNAGGVDEVVCLSFLLTWFQNTRRYEIADGVQINFLSMDDADVEATKANLLRTLGAAA